MSEIIDMFLYPNEHSARLHDPNDIDPDTYRRVNDGTIYGTVKVPQLIAVIWGKLKTHNLPKDEPIPQSLRFPTKDWTEAEARKWLKDNGIKFISFEPAKAKEKQAGERGMVFDGDTQLRDIPSDAFELTWNGDVTCFTDDQDKSKIRLTLYDGSVVKHFYWGNLGFALSGMELANDKIPILGEHNTEMRVGFSTSASFDRAFVLEGELLKSSPAAKEYRRDSIDGFPFQASLRMDKDKSVYEFIGEGKSVQVNGHQLQGPGTLFSKTVIMEGSICVFGALRNTKSAVFSNAEDADLSVAQKSTAAVRQLFGKFVEKFGDDPAFCIERFNKGDSLEQATEAWIEKLKAEKQQLSNQVRQQAKVKIDPAMQEFSDQQQGPKKTIEETTEVNEMLDFTQGDERLAKNALRKMKLAEAEGRIQVI
jgi:hypothetical protein